MGREERCCWGWDDGPVSWLELCSPESCCPEFGTLPLGHEWMVPLFVPGSVGRGLLPAAAVAMFTYNVGKPLQVSSHTTVCHGFVYICPKSSWDPEFHFCPLWMTWFSDICQFKQFMQSVPLYCKEDILGLPLMQQLWGCVHAHRFQNGGNHCGMQTNCRVSGGDYFKLENKKRLQFGGEKSLTVKPE